MAETAVAPNPTRSWSRIDGIDALRALAILYVLLNHINMRLLFARVPYTHGWPPQLAIDLVWRGQQGVQIFFAISGFLITSTALRRWGKLSSISLRDFYLIRFARIAPLLLTLLATLSALHFLGLKDFVVSPKTGGLPHALFAALTFHVGYIEATRGYLPANWDILWSLGVEELFYLGFPLACRFLTRGKLLYVLLAAFIVLGPFGRTILTHGNEVWQEYSYLGGMDAIAMGCLTAILLAYSTLTHRTRTILYLSGAALTTTLLFFSLSLIKLRLDHYGLGMSLLALGTCLLLAAFASSPSQAPTILQPLLAYGRRSYEIYLTHMFVVFALFDTFRAHGKPLALVAPLFLATILISGVLGELIGRFYTEPLNQRIRRHFRDDPTHLGSIVTTHTAHR